MSVLKEVARPFTDILEESPETTELVINGEGRAFVEIKGQWVPRPEIATSQNVDRFNAALNSHARGNLDKKNPLLSASLPTGERVQTIVQPVVTSFALSFRKPSTLDLSMEDYAAYGAFKSAAGDEATATPTDLLDRSFKAAQENRNYESFFKDVIINRQTVIISGGTSSGKTTFFNAVCKLIPDTERLISIEDVPELTLKQPNWLSLIAQRSSDRVNFISLLEACLRLRPDRILAAEIRSGSEALAFLEGANTGHPGSMTTVHANNTVEAKDRLTLMLMRENIGLTREQIHDYLNQTVHCFVHMARVGNIRKLTEISYRGTRVNL